GAPARAHAVGAADEDRLDPADLVVLDLEQLAELPGPVDRPVVEEGEREDHAALPVHRDEAAVANGRDDTEQRGLELLAAAEPGPERADRRTLGRGGDDAVLVAQAVIGEGVVALAVVALDRLEVGVGDRDEV